MKSNSFNNFNSKPRIKLVDEVVPQKQKGAIEHISKNIETPAGMISKSMSFKSSNLGRSNTNESKAKLGFSKPAIVQDLKALRHTKESGSLDRKFQPKIDRPVNGSTVVSSVVSTSKGDHKLGPHGETTKPYTVNNNREFKANQDGKVYSLSKSINNTGSRSPESQVSSGVSVVSSGDILFLLYYCNFSPFFEIVHISCFSNFSFLCSNSIFYKFVSFFNLPMMDFCAWN